MNPCNNIQSSFLSEMRKSLHSNISLADELAETLRISRDSAYRRIRGETDLSLDEIKTICNRYTISLDGILISSSGSVTFQSQATRSGDPSLHSWLTSVLDSLTRMKDFPERHILVVARELPFFHFFQFPELAAFKIYFWLTTLAGTGYQHQKFNLNIISKEYLSIAGRISERYQRIPSTEIWSEETARVTLRQIEYCHECGFFQNAKDLQVILDQYGQVLDNIQDQCASARKEDNQSSCHVYKNDILTTGSTMLLKMGERKVCLLQYDVPGMLSTSQASFCNQMEENINNLISKSDLISSSGEKERIRFFNGMRDQVAQTRHKAGIPLQVSFLSPTLKLRQA